MIKALKTCERRICQGDIIANIEHIEHVAFTPEHVEVSKITFPFVIVLTQDCDLAQDYRVRWSRQATQNQDKMLFSVLVAPLYNVEHVYTGEHLSELKMQMQAISRNKTPGANLRSNETPRYHHLVFPKEIPIAASVIDFKHYFSVNVEYLKKLKRTEFVCKVAEVYREDISLRFANFLSRIGLPEPPRTVAKAEPAG
jgi:hypothetical protein